MKNCSPFLNFILFADDTNICTLHKDVIILFYIFNLELCLLSNWFKVNKSSLNIGKTNFLKFSKYINNKSDTSNLTLKIDDRIVERESVCKFLSLTINCHGSHIYVILLVA